MSLAEQRKIKELEAEIKLLRDRQSLAWVGETVGRLLATALAAKPYARWNLSEKEVLHAACGSATGALMLYINSLPKE